MKRSKLMCISCNNNNINRMLFISLCGLVCSSMAQEVYTNSLTQLWDLSRTVETNTKVIDSNFDSKKTVLSDTINSNDNVQTPVLVLPENYQRSNGGFVKSDGSFLKSVPLFDQKYDSYQNGNQVSTPSLATERSMFKFHSPKRTSEAFLEPMTSDKIKSIGINRRTASGTAASRSFSPRMIPLSFERNGDGFSRKISQFSSRSLNMANSVAHADKMTKKSLDFDNQTSTERQIQKPLLLVKSHTKRIADPKKAVAVQSSIDKSWKIAAATSRSSSEDFDDEDRKKLKKKKPFIKKKYQKYILPLLLAYKLKFFTLIPLLMGGLILLTGSTGLAGFFFALFASVIGLRSAGNNK